MKKILFLSTIFCGLLVNGQNITFTGAGLSTVKIENLTKGASVNLNAGDVLILSSATGIIQIEKNTAAGMNIYPNPMTDKSTFEILPPVAGDALISVYETNGKPITQIKTYLESSLQKFSITGIKNGFYLINVKANTYQFSGKLICNGKSNGTTSIENVSQEIQAVDEKASKMDYKGLQADPSILYSTGDILKFTGISGSNTKIVTAKKITQDTTITFSFIACTDGDGNNYPVVQIGTQVWMAENLKATKYNDNSTIPLATGNIAWASLSTHAYCWYNNDATTYKDNYGGLYNFYTVNAGNICPVGWHIPTDAEWSTLTTYLGGESVAGGKLKETSTMHWTDPNTGATDETGFASLPGGARNLDGTFGFIGGDGHWWSSSEDNTDVWIRYMSNNYSGVARISVDKVYGLSVRCVRDIVIETEAAINDTLELCYTKLYSYIELAYLFDAVYSNSISAPAASWTEIYGHTQSQDSNNEKILKLWSDAYNIIFKINLVIKSAEIVISDQPTRYEIIAQAKALRAYIYYYLVSWFGEVPLEEGISEGMIPRSTVDKVLLQIKQDATQAAQSLPASWPASDKFRFSQNFAKGLLSRASLFNKNYNDAFTPTQQIINSGMYALSADTTNFSSTNIEIFWGFEKSSDPVFSSFFTKGSYVPAIRYTESYLVSAEALHNSGNTVSALNYINALNVRRGKPNVTTLTNDDIFLIWRRELIKEGNIFITLKRFDKALTVVQNFPHKLLLPVPLTFIISNPNLTQNPGY